MDGVTEALSKLVLRIRQGDTRIELEMVSARPDDIEKGKSMIREIMDATERQRAVEPVLAVRPPAKTPTPEPVGLTLRNGMDWFQARLNLRVADGTLRLKTQIETMRTLERFHGWLRKHQRREPYLSDIDSRLMAVYRDHMLAPEADGGEGLQAITCKKNLGFILSLFRAFMELHPDSASYNLPINPIRVFQRGEMKRVQKKNSYEMFTDDDLRKIFNPVNLLNAYRPHDFWLPLIARYAGGRIEELCQFFTEDVIEREGDYFFQFVHRPGQTKLKGDSSYEREVWIHDDLIRMGFLTYLEEARAYGGGNNNGRLFPYLKRGGIEEFSASPSKAFSRYLRRIGVKNGPNGTQKVFHSFRKTLVERLEKLGISDSVGRILLGHVGGGDVHERHYKVGRPVVNRKMLTTLHYTDIDVGSLSYDSTRYSKVMQG